MVDGKVEVARAHYRPERITTLFVGESAPFSGAFFYYGNSAMTRHMQRAVEFVLGASSNFLDSLWAKRKSQIKGVIESTVGMYGDLQGIAGKALQEIDGLDVQLLDHRALMPMRSMENRKRALSRCAPLSGMRQRWVA